MSSPNRCFLIFFLFFFFFLTAFYLLFSLSFILIMYQAMDPRIAPQRSHPGERERLLQFFFFRASPSSSLLCSLGFLACPRSQKKKKNKASFTSRSSSLVRAPLRFMRGTRARSSDSSSRKREKRASEGEKKERRRSSLPSKKSIGRPLCLARSLYLDLDHLTSTSTPPPTPTPTSTTSAVGLPHGHPYRPLR